MNIKKITTLLILLGGALMVYAGCARPWRDMATMDSLSDASRVIRALEQLRANDTNGAIATLEQMLDGEILSLGGALAPNGFSNDMQRQVARRITVYRQMHPSISEDAAVVDGVRIALTKLQKKVGQKAPK